jgi:hypothetical protein
MAFLTSNPRIGNEAIGNKTNATKNGGWFGNNATQLSSTTKADEKGNSASMWETFQDRLLENEEKMKDTANSFFNEEVKRVESKTRQSPQRNNIKLDSIINEDNILLLSQDAIKELELQEQSLPDRWLDFFCIVGLDPEATLVKDEEEGAPKNKPILLDRFPKEDHLDMEFPEHLPTFCFPNGGCRPLRYKTRYQESPQESSKKEKKKLKEKINIRYHHNAPDPFLSSMVLTSGSGHRLYCTALTVYEMREHKKTAEEVKKEEEDKRREEEAEKNPPIPEFNEKWWEEPDEKSAVKFVEEYYWMVPKCLVLLSHYPFFQAQSIALKELFYTVQSGASPFPFERYVAHLIEEVPLPRSGVGRQRKRQNYTVVEWMSWTQPARNKASKIPPTIRLERPPPNQLPMLNVSMEPLFRTLSLSNILVIWATLFQEGKVVLACSSSETIALLAPIAEALLALLFPLEWQGIYVPVLPNHDSVLDILEAPVPYLIGLVTKPSDQQIYNPQTHPNGVLWCDLDNDALHLGFKGDRLFYGQNNQDAEEVPMLPALPSEASMALKAELEEIADPLYLPTVKGIKGRITVGDRTIELDNTLRQPYAQRTKVFEHPMATPRKYILTQSSKIPPRGKALKYDDFSIVPKKKSERKEEASPSVASTADETEFCGLTLEDIQIPCGEDAILEGKKADDLKFRVTKPKTETNDGESDSEEDAKPTTTNQDLGFLLSLKRQSRSVQAHVDRAMAVFGQEYAKPSEYAARSSQQYMDDVLSRQDDISANLFSVKKKETRIVAKKVRESFLRFFLATFGHYKSYFHSVTKRFDDSRFVDSLNLSYRQREYVKEVVTSQMFEIFLQDTRSIKHRKLFDEYAVRHRNGDFSLTANKESSRTYGTPLLNSSQWRNPTIVVPGQPCRVGLKDDLKKRRIYSHDRRFPDALDPAECITNKSVPFGKNFWDGAFCSVFSCCT